MVKENKSHEQGQMFAEEDRMHPRLREKLSNHWSGMFYERIFCNIDEEIFKALYCEHFGRGNFPVNILVSLEIIKEMFALTDEQLFDRYHFDLSIRRALGLKDINEQILAPRTFYYFRFAVARYSFENGVDLYMQVFADGRDKYIEELGIKTGLQRTDSTMIGANIKKMTRLALFHKVLSNLVKDILKSGYSVSTEIQEIVKDDEDGFTYRLKKEEVLSKTQEVGEHIYSLIKRYEFEDSIRATKGYQDAERLLRERCNISEGKPTLKGGKDIDSSSMQNPSDTDATYRKKRNKEHEGYAAHATETCDKDNKIQVITDIDLVPNNKDDAKVLADKIENLKKETGLETVITDGTFVSPKVREECRENKVNLISSEVRGNYSKYDTDKMLTSRDFDIDATTDEVKSCPEGQSPTSQKITEKEVVARFSVKVCRECIRNENCIAYFKSSNQSWIKIDETRKLLDERRELTQTECYRELCNLRPPVEGLMEKLKPKYLNGRTLFRGLRNVKNRMILRAIGINFKRYSAYKLDLLAHSLYKFKFLVWKFIFWIFPLANRRIHAYILQ